MMATLGWLVFTAVLALAALFVLQDRLLYFPSRVPLAGWASSGLVPWPTQGPPRALVATPRGGARGTVLVFHGNAGHAGDRAHYAQALMPLGWRVVLAEYPGYGPRGGTPGEATLVADAVATLDEAHRGFGAPLVVLGESLGAAVAAQAAAQRPDAVAGLVLVTPWDRLQHVAAHHYPWLPVRWLLRDGYDSAQALRGFARPVWITVAARDQVVPARFGRALHAGLGARRHLDVREGSDHNDWPDRVDAAWWHTVLAFATGDAAESSAPPGQAVPPGLAPAPAAPAPAPREDRRRR